MIIIVEEWDDLGIPPGNYLVSDLRAGGVEYDTTWYMGKKVEEQLRFVADGSLFGWPEEYEPPTDPPHPEINPPPPTGV